MTVHHIGYLVKKLDKARESFAVLGFAPVADAVYDEGRDVDIQFLSNGAYTVELVSPKSPRSVVAELIKTYKNAPYHLCYETEDFDAELARLEGSGFIRMGDAAPAPAIGSRRVCFLYSARIGMIEILEGN